MEAIHKLVTLLRDRTIQFDQVELFTLEQAAHERRLIEQQMIAQPITLGAFQDTVVLRKPE